ncbi:GBS Bsp-like repeat-containing protein [Enterococcus sp. BWT-B8]|uniref:glycerophosphodiester phosphodiesterase family protein n=1 Tax=Enterococcus sp. BWT-B8 TaxID=2885157 RepID=UPI001E397FFB|nr:glycerophosphodiester phosphodiesterase family protein [Enterococcus sp. BWT-B8]MCB5951508.1 GBS Bsp-like repeat-containing protein [Enterococcus sp. BWT-B8]
MEKKHTKVHKHKKKADQKTEMKKREKRELWLTYGSALLIIVSVSVIFGYWSYYRLDYQNRKTASSYEGYELSKPDFIYPQRYLTDSNENLYAQTGEIRVNPLFSEKLLTSVVQKGSLETSLILPATKPVFELVDSDKKQSNYRIIADLSSMYHIERVEFLTWGLKNGPDDIQRYEGTYDPYTNTWQSDILVKNHQETGNYQTDIIITKKSGKVEQALLAEFTVYEPSIQATIDGTLAARGQFDVNISVDSRADVEKLSVPVWTKEDQSDVRWYEAKRQADDSYKVQLDYEDFNFTNGMYTASAYLTTVSGLSAQSAAGTTEINMTHPVRIRVLQETTLFKDRKLTQKISELGSNSMAYVTAVVFNSDQKVYKTEDGYISSQDIEVNEMMDDIRYVAHRGNHQVAPENSLPSFQQSSSWGIETDVWLTKDKKWVIMHDDTVDRMTNGKGKISDMTLAQIRELRIDTGANLSSYDQSQLIVPTLEEYLTIMGSKQSVPFIEMKAKNLSGAEYDSLVSLINQYGFANTAVVISFDFNNLQEIKKRAPQMQVQLLGDTIDTEMINKVSGLGVNTGLDIQYSGVVSKVDMIAKAQAKGLSVHLWGVPQSEFRRMEALGIDNLTTDYD